MYTILVHISNQEPVKIDVDDIPSPQDTCIVGKNPRLRTDSEVTWLEDGVTTVIFPWWRVNFVQILPTGEEQIEFELPYRDD
ncbi:hypothetical protein G4Y79_15865 [Phototrophicus methaneseepsis]|uniref:Uncharacterized protein n=1 Tax=Phototrophicus methaneseepsis TaxID=2710758 RepID=A0A7S8IDU5_9CHLR|nr:hypothetical protein [Phototrophicus methaneseepsis]QPC81178.1 hypothetical protein G4Y79_15865 [Phototrophicus methaneseepsis]